MTTSIVPSAEMKEDIISKVVEHFTTGQSVAVLNMVEKGDISKEHFLREVEKYVKSKYVLSAELTNEVVEGFRRFMWGYYIIDPLIDDEDVSDIRLLGENEIYYKKNGKRIKSDIHFHDRKDYERFCERVVLKNKINAGSQNAIQCFTDKSDSRWIMRFNFSTGFVMSSGKTMIHIRKHNRNKKLLDRLVI